MFDTSPASARLTTDGTFGTVTLSSQTAAFANGSLTAPLEVGETYRVQLRLRREAACTQVRFEVDVNVPFHNLAVEVFTGGAMTSAFPAGQFATYTTPPFTVSEDSEKLPDVDVFLDGPLSTILGYVDSVVFLVAKTTIVDRRGFKRRKILQVQQALPADNVAANKIGDAWLPGHATTPFKGQITVVGDGSARNVLTGEDVPPSRLGLMVMEPARFSNRIDPDTGGHGRDGRIVAVRYTHAERKAEVTIDNTNQNFEALLNRYGLLADGS